MAQRLPRPPARRRAPAPRTRAAAALEFREVDRATWPDFVRLFERPGAPKYCWCMAWRPMAAKDRAAGNARKKGCLHALVEAGTPVGILGYLHGEPVAWCSIAPRETYRPLGGADEPGDAPGSVWSLACFFLVRGLRGQGASARLLAAAVAHAGARGATAVEAYPVAPGSPSYGFMGRVPAFERAGFRHVGRAGTRRHVMRLDLSSAAKPRPRGSPR